MTTVKPGGKDFEMALKITPLFYDAVLSPDSWQTALKTLVDWFPGSKGAALHLFSVPDYDTQYLHVNYGFTEKETALYMAFEDRLQGDPRAPVHLGAYVNKPCHCRQLVADEVWYASPIYKQVYHPSNIDYTLIFAILHETDGVLFSGGIFRPTHTGPFDDYDVAKLQLLMPHLRRAGQVYARIIKLEEQNRQLAAILEAWELPTILVNENGSIVGKNRGADDLLNAQDGLDIQSEKVCHLNSEVNAALQSAIGRVVSSIATGQEPMSEHIELPRHANRKPLRAAVCSLAGNPNRLAGWIPNQMRAAIFITDPVASYETTGEKMQRLYALTETEGDILAAITNGQKLRDISEQTGRSYETVRTHVKNIMSKTGTTSQVELIRLALTSA